MKIIICDKCDTRIEMKEVGDKYISLDIYERKKMYEAEAEANYSSGSFHICYDCFEKNLNLKDK